MGLDELRMNCEIRKARWEDYESVIRIMNQVQKMHVEWRPDIYKMCDEIRDKSCPKF
jgi:hypothetical protein